MDIHVGDDNVGVEKSPKFEWPLREVIKRSYGEKPLTEVGKRARVRLTIEFVFGQTMSHSHPSLVRHMYKIDQTKHTY